MSDDLEEYIKHNLSDITPTTAAVKELQDAFFKQNDWIKNITPLKYNLSDIAPTTAAAKRIQDTLPKQKDFVKDNYM